MGENTDIDALLERMQGRFEGDERIVVDPAERQAMTATGKFSNSVVLDGSGIRADYEQVTNGEVGMRCETLFRFDADGTAVLAWVPSEGDPQIYAGSFDGFRIEVAHAGDGGTQQVITADYSDALCMTNSMQVHLPDGTAMTVFEGEYRRLPAALGQAVWRDLTIADAVALKGFYENVLGWSSAAADMGGYEDFHMLDSQGQVAAGICHARGGNADLPPVWLPYFSVDSADDAAVSARDGGGRVVAGPKQYDRYRYAVIEDPAGASFVACQEVVS